MQQKPAKGNTTKYIPSKTLKHKLVSSKSVMERKVKQAKLGVKAGDQKRYLKKITFMPGRLVFTSLTCSECELLGISWTLRMLFLLAGLDLVTVMTHYMDKCNHPHREGNCYTITPF